MVSGVEVQGTLCHTIEGISSFTVVSPEEIEGMQVQYRNGTYTVSFEGIVQSDMKSVMDESVFGRLLQLWMAERSGDGMGKSTMER